MPIKNKSQINDNINLKINDNTTEEITPEDIRDVLKDMNDSSLNRLDDNVLGLKAYNTGKSYVYGDTAMYDNILYTCIDTTTGTFNPDKWQASTASPIEAENGLSVDDNKVKLGGSLTENTTINLGYYGLEFTSGSTYKVNVNNNIDLHSNADITLDATHLNLNGNSGVVLDSNSNMNISANASMNISANAPLTISSNANIDLTSNAPINLRATASPIFLKSDNAPIYFNTPYALRYQNNDSDSSLYGGGSDLFVPHIKWVKDFLYDYAGTDGSVAIFSGTNGITIEDDLIGLSGNYVHTSDNYFFGDEYYNTATSIEATNYTIKNYHYGSDGSVLDNSTYQFNSGGAYFYANNNKSKLRFESDNLEYTSEIDGDSTYRFQKNNLYISTADSDYSHRMQWALTPNGIYSYTQNGASDNTTFTTGSSQFYYSATQSSNYFYLQATASQLYYNSNTPTTNINFSGGTSLNYYYYNSSTSDSVSFNAGTTSLYYSNTGSESVFSLGSDNFQIKTGNELVFDNRTLQSSAGIVLNWGAGHIKQNFTTISDNYDVLVNDYMIVIEGTNGIVINLPYAIDNSGREIFFKHKNRLSYTTTLTAQTGELIDDINTFLIASSYSNVKLFCDGVQWLIMNN